MRTYGNSSSPLTRSDDEAAGEEDDLAVRTLGWGVTGGGWRSPGWLAVVPFPSAGTPPALPCQGALLMYVPSHPFQGLVARMHQAPQNLEP